MIASVSDLISETIYETRKVLLYSENRSEQLYAEHEQIYQAIKNREPENARKYMYDHLERVNQDLFTHIDRMG